MTERLLRAVRGLVAQFSLALSSGMPQEYIPMLSIAFYQDVIEALCEIDGVDTYGVDDMIIWFLDHVSKKAVESKGHVPEEIMDKLVDDMRNMLGKANISQYPHLQDRLAELSENKTLDLSIYEDFFAEEDDNG